MVKIALINNIYVFVENEKIDRNTSISSHPVEKGINVTDHVKREAKTLSITGQIVGSNYKEIKEKLTKLNENGTIVKYVGKDILNNAVIERFSTDVTQKIKGGYTFDMTIKEIRIAKSPYSNTTKKKTATKKSTSTKQITTKTTKSKKVYHKVKKGDTVWALVAASKAPYKKYGKSCKWVLQNNPKCFSRKNDYGTLKVGSSLWVGNS